MKDKEGEERLLLREKMVQLQDAALDSKFELMKVDFDVGDILRRQHMERKWMEFRIMIEAAWATDTRSLSTANRGNRHIEHISMVTTYNSVMAVEPVNLHLLAALRKVSPQGAAGLRSEQLKRKWAPQEEELSFAAAKRTKLIHAVAKMFSPKNIVEPRDGDSELLDDGGDDDFGDDDGKLCDVKRLDEEIARSQLDKVAWRKFTKEGYKWYYPYADLSSREQHLTRLAEHLAKRAEARGAALPTECEVIGYMLLDLLTTSAMSPSASASFFLAP